MPAALSVGPRAINFPTQVVLGEHGSTSQPRNVRLIDVSNRKQNAPIYISGIVTDDPEFNSARACIGTLAPGTHCQVAITFTPNQPGPRAGNLVVTSNGTNPVVEIPVRGAGRLGRIGISPRPLNFGRIAIGSQVQKSIILKNRNPVAMGIGAITSSDPQFSASGCAQTEIAPMSSCAVTLTFTPSGSGEQAASLSIEDNAAGSPHIVRIVGIGR